MPHIKSKHVKGRLKLCRKSHSFSQKVPRYKGKIAFFGCGVHEGSILNMMICFDLVLIVTVVSSTLKLLDVSPSSAWEPTQCASSMIHCIAMENKSKH